MGRKQVDKIFKKNKASYTPDLRKSLNNHILFKVIKWFIIGIIFAIVLFLYFENEGVIK